MSINTLKKIGLNVLGNNIQISKKVSFHNTHNITLQDNIRIDDHVVLSATGKIHIGNYVHIARNCLIYSGTNIQISDFANISASCKLYGITDNYDGSVLIGPTIPDNLRNVIKGDIYLDKYSIIGTTSIILPNTILHEGAAVGALSIVKGELKEWNIYGGNPLRLLKERNKECKILGEKLII